MATATMIMTIFSKVIIALISIPLSFILIYLGTATVVFTGDSAVGKTNIMNGIAKSAPFEYQHIETIGVEFSTTTMKVDGMQIKLQMWDVAAKTLKGETYSESAITTA